MNTFLQDIRYGFRSLFKTPAFTAIVVLTLALGMGANTAIFSVVNAVLLEPLPFRNPEELMILWVDNKPQDIHEDVSSYPNFEDWRNENQVFESVVAYTAPSVTLTGDGEPEQVRSIMASAGFFQLLGVEPAHGRVLLPEENRPGREQIAVISDGLWKRRFGGVPNAVGQSLNVNGRPFTIAGIMPPDMAYPERVDLWLPLAPVGALEDLMRGRGTYWLSVIGRLKPGVSVDQAQAQMDILARELEARHPANQNVGIYIEPFLDELVGNVRPAMIVLLSAAGFVLLIACANIANLLLTRAAMRHRELAVRAALGAGRTRLLRQLLTESVLLSTISGIAGLGVTFILIRVLLSLAPPDIPRLTEVQVNAPVLLFCVLLSMMTGLLFGLVPALTSSGSDLNDSIKSAGRGASEGLNSRRMRSLLVVSEIAVALLLLTGASLLIKSFILLQDVNPGFSSQGILAARLQLPPLKYRGGQIPAFYNRLLERLRTSPGVLSADAASAVLLTRLPNSASVAIEGRTDGPPDPTPIPYDSITPGFFRTMGITLVRGRAFTEQDNAQAPPVVIVNEAFARKYWPGEEALGKRLTFGNTERSDVQWSAVVGVVADVRRSGLDLDARPETYFPMQQSPARSMQVLVKTQGDPNAVAGVLKDAVWSIDKDQPITMIRPMDALVAERVAQRRFSMMLLGFFAAAALTLAAVGIYGVISYSVTQRTRELGVRIALGAQRRDVIAMVLREGTLLTGAGIGLGLLGSLPLMRLLSAQLYAVAPTDAGSYAMVAVILGAAALLACFVPALRATRVDPLRALRHE